MKESKNREYAQSENNYLLSLLLRPDSAVSSENPQELAERNCRSTEECFGKSDPLHAMALNTLAFVYIYNDQNIEKAKHSAQKAATILRNKNGEEEMLLESKCLIVHAKIKEGYTSSSAIQEVFELPVADPDSVIGVQNAAKKLSEILASSVKEVRLTRILLMMTLNKITSILLDELESLNETNTKKTLESNLQSFLQTYYS